MGVLYYGAELFVKGASGLAKTFNVTPLLIGLLVVSVATSAPELIVCLLAAIKKSDDLSIGNIIGSNIANIGLILGISAVIHPIMVHKSIIKRELTFMIGASFIFYILSLNGIISRIDGAILLCLLVAFFVVSFRGSKKDSPPATSEEVIATEVNESKSKNYWITLGGGVGLLAGAHVVVGSGIEIARFFGISELTIGLTVVAIGTSLPELAASAAAAKKGESDICVGNVVGSNLFNLLMVIGTVSLINPVKVFSDVLVLHIPIMLLFSVVLIPIMKRDFLITRKEGVFLLGGYFSYIFFVYS